MRFSAVRPTTTIFGRWADRAQLPNFTTREFQTKLYLDDFYAPTCVSYSPFRWKSKPQQPAYLSFKQSYFDYTTSLYTPIILLVF